MLLKFSLYRTLAVQNPKRFEICRVPPVQKFTNREIAWERIWRFLHPPEQTTPRKAAEQKNPFREGSKAAQVYALVIHREPARGTDMGNGGWFGFRKHNGIVVAAWACPINYDRTVSVERRLQRQITRSEKQDGRS